jgi:hypothetical protein
LRGVKSVWFSEQDLVLVFEPVWVVDSASDLDLTILSSAIRPLPLIQMHLVGELVFHHRRCHLMVLCESLCAETWRYSLEGISMDVRIKQYVGRLHRA